MRTLPVIMLIAIVGVAAYIFQYGGEQPGAAGPVSQSETVEKAPASVPAPSSPQGQPAEREAQEEPAVASRPTPEPAAPPAPSPSQEPEEQPSARPAPQSQTPSQRQPRVVIQPPRGLSGVRFGMSAAAIARRFPPGWRREQGDELTLVHYPAGSNGPQIRFHFTGQGLSRLELRRKPPAGTELTKFYHQVRRQYEARYGSLPGSADSGWSDGNTVLAVELGATDVGISYRPDR